MNVFHARADLGWLSTAGGGLQSAVDALHAFYTTLAGDGNASFAILAEGVTAKLGTVVDIATQEEATPTFTPVTSLATTGSVAAPLMICASWRTTLAARRGRGRTFVGPIRGGWNEPDGTPYADAVNAIQTAAQTLVQTSRDGDGWALGVYGQQSMLSGPAITPSDRANAPHVIRDWTGVKVQDKWAVLRSRRD